MAPFYNLPSPWNPGYADPSNVDAEGLQRGTFTTLQMPRGTYDDPVVGRGGYDVPTYVMDEGYGQGAMVTKQMPRGETVVATPRYFETPTTMVGKVSAVRGGGAKYQMAVMAGLGATPIVTGGPLPEPGGAADPIRQYGVRAARTIVGRTQGLPPAERPIALKAILDTVDPGLWNRVQDRSKKYLDAGQSPNAAVEQALATSFSDGILYEIAQIGVKRQAPKTGSLMGLGCYGCVPVLGDVATNVATETAKAATAASATGKPAPRYDEYVEVGPFTFQAGDQEQRVVFHDPNAIPADWKKWFAAEVPRLTRAAQAQAEYDMRGTGTSGGPGKKAGSTGGDKANPGGVTFKKNELYKYRGTWGSAKVVDAKSLGLDRWFGMAPTTLLFDMFFNNTVPIIRTKHPKNGKEYAVFLTTSPTTFTVRFRESPPHKSLIQKIWDGIKSIPSILKKVAMAVYEAAKDVVEALGDLACDALNTPGVDTVAAAGAAIYGVPPQATAAGADAGRQMCNGKKPVVPPPPPPPGIGLGWIAAGLAAAGGAVWYYYR